MVTTTRPVGEILADLKNGSVTQRNSAARELSELEDFDYGTVTELLKRLKVEDEAEVLVELVKTIAKTRDFRAADAIRYWDHDTNKRLRQTVADSLLIMKLPTMSEFALLDEWSGGGQSEEMRVTIFEALVNKGRIGIVIPALSHELPAIRRAAIKAVVEEKITTAVPKILELISGEADATLRQEMLGAVRALSPQEAANFEESLHGGELNDDDPDVRFQAVQEMSKTLTPEKARMLLARLEREVSAIIQSAIKDTLLADPTVLTVTEWLTFADKEDDDVRSVALDAIEATFEENHTVIAVSQLIEFLSHDNWEIRQLAAKCLGEVESEIVKNTLQAKLEAGDESDEVMDAVKESLKKQGGDVTVLLEIARLSDDDWTERKSAANELASIDDPRVVPALLDRFDEESDSDVETAIGEALQDKSADGIDSDRLIELLGDDTVLVVQWAAKNLGSRDGKEITDALIAELEEEEDDDDVVRALVAALDGRDTEYLTTENLIEKLDSERWGVRQWAAILLGDREGPDVAGALTNALEYEEENDNDDDVKEALNDALAKRDDVDIIQMNIDRLSDDDSDVRQRTLDKLKDEDDPKVTEALVDRLDEEVDSDILENIISALEDRDLSEISTARFLELLEYDDEQVRALAAKELGNRDSDKETVVPALINRWENEDESDVIDAIEEALKTLDAVLELAIRKLNWDDDTDIRTEGAEALGEIDDPKATEALISRLAEEDDNDVVDSITQALENKTLSVETSKLLEMLDAETSGARIWVVEKLAEQDDSSAYLTILEKMADESDDDVLEAYRDNFEQKEMPTVSISKLTEYLANDNWYVRQLAASVLGNKGGPSAVRALKKQYKEEDDSDVKNTIEEALGKLGEEVPEEE